jgi:hypothetical protein
MRIFQFFVTLVALALNPTANAFPIGRAAITNSPLVSGNMIFSVTVSSTTLFMAQVSEKEAKSGIEKVVAALKRDAAAKAELGNIDKVTVVLGYGSPSPGTLAVRFNASFKKGGFGRSAVPLPFGIGQSEKSEGRGQMVGQVKASLDMKTGKVTSCSVFRDLGYGRAFNLKC